MDMSIRFPHLGVTLESVGKSVNLFGFEVAYYGIIIAAAMLIGMGFVVLEAKRTNQDQDFYLNMLLISLVSAVVGARLYYVAFSWEFYKNDPIQIFYIRNGGLAIYGGIIGGVLSAAIFCHVKKVSFWQVADTCCESLVIGQMIGRWGNFFNREAFGEYTDGLLAMQLPVSAVRSGEITAQMKEHLVTVGGVEYIQVHPTFLYESLWCLALLLVLMWYHRRKGRFPGGLFLLYLAGYGLGRFWIEGLRTDQLLLPGTKVPASQLLSAVLVVLCAVAFVVNTNVTKKRAELKKQRREKDIQETEAIYGGSDEDSDSGEKSPQPEKASEGGRKSQIQEDKPEEEKEPEYPERKSEGREETSESVDNSRPQETESVDGIPSQSQENASGEEKPNLQTKAPESRGAFHKKERKHKDIEIPKFW